jgi:thiol:disulfide interchange protein
MRPICAVALSTILAFSAPSAWATKAHAEDVRWHRDLTSAVAEAERSNRPLFLLITSRDCGWCRKLETTTLRDVRVVRKLNGDTIPLKIDADNPANSELLAALRVEGVPTSAIVRPNGRVQQTHAGYLDPPGFLGWLREAVSDSK